MLNDYYKRFPPSTQTTPPRPESYQTPRQTQTTNLPETPQASIPVTSQTQEAHPSSDDEREEGELRDSAASEWDDYLVPTPSPPPAGPVDSPPEDIGGFHNLIERAAKRFCLSIVSHETECFLYDFKEPSKRSVRAIPIVDFLWQEGLKAVKNPATVPSQMPRLEKKYKAPDDSPACLVSQPKPDSVISQAAQRRSRNPSTPIASPPDKEGRRLDNIGKKFSSVTAVTVKAANSLAILGRYDRQMWADMSAFLDLLPEDVKVEAKKVLQEGERVSAEIIDSAIDISLTGFRQLAGAAVLRRQGWLKATSFRPEVQSRVLDMPFDGESLFGKHVDDMLQAIKTDTDTAKSLGTLQYKKQPFRGARGRGNYSFRGGYQQYRSQYQSSSTGAQHQYHQQQQHYRLPPAAAYKHPARGRGAARGRDTGRKQ
ncbi:hypothetical protein NDU88_000929 [Pleurodeles waltl]|uniref:Uncharacterized protein n=1 Tax=Pleurodeles waltl TaxID=8319 RepID=A0AAV7R7H9_PLEWA|nr:hypothetical protein NDU88_000929 [Pleurodeles waltl]